jgi:hypothetical protein
MLLKFCIDNVLRGTVGDHVTNLSGFFGTQFYELFTKLSKSSFPRVITIQMTFDFVSKEKNSSSIFDFVENEANLSDLSG